MKGTRVLEALRAPVLMVMVGWVAACGGMSTEDAQERCGVEREVDGSECVEDFGQCVECYEECGDSCTRNPGCPATFSCPD